MDEPRNSLLPTLLELLLLGAKDRPVAISTVELAKKIGKSQQAASKHLLELEKEGYLERIKAGSFTGVKLSPKGVDSVTSLYRVLKASLEGRPPTLEIKGEVFSGLGEGGYYVSHRGYRKQFVKKLRFDPYPGTLNIKLTSPVDRKLRGELEKLDGITIEGFEDGQRTYGGAKCFKALVNDSAEAAVLTIERTHYDDSVLEVLSPVKLRDTLKLQDRSPVTVMVYLSEEMPSKSGS
ncbi:MAG: CTP-dependent riboflavin kinase [Thaumarchaeota archaeon]|nr:CTP-dependent riboflavin kinase [Nitrososphaerota archaeon]